MRGECQSIGRFAGDAGEYLGELFVEIEAVLFALVAAIAESLKLLVHRVEPVGALTVKLCDERLIALRLPPHSDDENRGNRPRGSDGFEGLGDEGGIHILDLFCGWETAGSRHSLSVTRPSA